MSAAPPETITLPQATLTRLSETDAADLAAAVRTSLEHLRPWMPWASEAAADVDAQRARARESQQLWDFNTEYIYTMRGSGEALVGTFGLHRRIGPRAIEIGYWVHVDHARRGYATAAAAALTEAGLDLDDIDRVEIHTDEANAASAAVPRKLGYLLDRVDERPPQAPAESGRLQIWITTR